MMLSIFQIILTKKIKKHKLYNIKRKTYSRNRMIKFNINNLLPKMTQEYIYKKI